MKRKGFKKTFVAILAVLVMVCGTVKPLYASNDIMLLSMDETKSVSLSISSGKATATCVVVGTKKTLDKIVINMYLQKKGSDGVWDNYKSWYSTKSGYTHSLSKTCSVPSGTYRVMARVICYNDGDAETSYMYTGSKKR